MYDLSARRMYEYAQRLTEPGRVTSETPTSRRTPRRRELSFPRRRRLSFVPRRSYA